MFDEGIEEVLAVKSMTPSVEGDMSESTTSLPGDSHDSQGGPTGMLQLSCCQFFTLKLVYGVRLRIILTINMRCHYL